MLIGASQERITRPEESLISVSAKRIGRIKLPGTNASNSSFAIFWTDWSRDFKLFSKESVPFTSSLHAKENALCVDVIISDNVVDVRLLPSFIGSILALNLEGWFSAYSKVGMEMLG